MAEQEEERDEANLYIINHIDKLTQNIVNSIDDLKQNVQSLEKQLYDTTQLLKQEREISKMKDKKIQSLQDKIKQIDSSSASLSLLSSCK